MTVKVYKKRTHWYYKYHCEEIDLGTFIALDTLESLLNKKVFYFKITDHPIKDVVGIIKYFSLTCKWYLDTELVRIFPEIDYPNINLPEEVYETNMLWVALK